MTTRDAGARFRGSEPMMSTGAYGERIGRMVHVERPPTLGVQTLRTGFMAITRLRRARSSSSIIGPMPREDAFLVSLQLAARRPYELWLEGRPYTVEPARIGSSTVLNLNLASTAEVGDPFDALVFYVPRSALDAMSEQENASRIELIDVAPSAMIDDPVIYHLGSSLLPALERPEQANQLFIDHVSAAWLSHVTQRYGHLRARPRSGSSKLAAWQERRAKELLLSRLDGNLTLDELARECGLSRSHFARAFRNTTGEPAHRWLLHQRIERARTLLQQSSLTIERIASALGFADQSHLTRVFRGRFGHTPGQWRRRYRQ